jgi:hypothetical protein
MALPSERPLSKQINALAVGLTKNALLKPLRNFPNLQPWMGAYF